MKHLLRFLAVITFLTGLGLSWDFLVHAPEVTAKEVSTVDIDSNNKVVLHTDRFDASRVAEDLVRTQQSARNTSQLIGFAILLGSAIAAGHLAGLAQILANQERQLALQKPIPISS